MNARIVLSRLLSRLLNCNTDVVEEGTERGRAFHVDAAADWKDRLPMAERIVRGTIRSEDEAERSRWRVCTSETHCNKDVRYSGAEPWRHRYISTVSQNVIRSATSKFSDVKFLRILYTKNY